MLRVRDVMTSDVITLSPDSLLGAIQLFAEEQVTGAPVVEGSRVIGVLAASDVMEFASSAAGPDAKGGEDVEPEDGSGAVTHDEIDRDDEPAAALDGDYFGTSPAWVSRPGTRRQR